MTDSATLLELTIAAEEQVDTYRNPYLGEWIAAIDPVLAAVGKGSIARDSIEEISVSDDTLTIHTSYTVRGCEQTNCVRLPLAIIKAENPLQAATLYRLEKELAEAKSNVVSAQDALARNTKRVAALEAEIAAVRIAP